MGRKGGLPPRLLLSPLSSNRQPQKLYPTPRRGDTCLCLCRTEQQHAGRKRRFTVPDEYSGEFWLGQSDPGCLRSGLLSTGDAPSEQQWEETLISVSCIRDKTNPTDPTQPSAGISDAGLKLLLVATMVLLLKF